MFGLILINAYTVRESELNQPLRLKEELEKLGVGTQIIRNNAFPARIFNNRICTDIPKVDFCIYLDKDEYTSKIMEESGIRLFNSHKSVLLCDDKMKTCIALAKEGIPIPDTLPAPLCYSPEAEIPLSSVKKTEEILGYPIVVKECYGSLGKGVYLAENREELTALMNKLKTVPHIYQKLVASSFGRDVRVILVGGKVVTAMLRTSAGDFRSNLELGGSGKPFALPKSFEELAVRTAKCLNLDYCGIDILFGEGARPVICEVNSNAFFGGIEKVTGINVAKAYAEYIVNSVGK